MIIANITWTGYTEPFVVIVWLIYRLTIFLRNIF